MGHDTGTNLNGATCNDHNTKLKTSWHWLVFLQFSFLSYPSFIGEKKWRVDDFKILFGLDLISGFQYSKDFCLYLQTYLYMGYNFLYMPIIGWIVFYWRQKKTWINCVQTYTLYTLYFIYISTEITRCHGLWTLKPGFFNQTLQACYLLCEMKIIIPMTWACYEGSTI